MPCLCHSPDLLNWISGLRAALLLFLPRLAEQSSCPRLDLPGSCHHRSPGQNLSSPTSSAGDTSPAACGTSLQHAPIPRSPSQPHLIGRILLPISHQLNTKQWSSLNSEADGFKFSFEPDQDSQNLEDQVWEPNPSSKHSKLATVPQCLKSNVPFFNLGGDTTPRVSTAAWLLQVFTWKAQPSFFSRATQGMRVLDAGCCLIYYRLSSRCRGRVSPGRG